MKIPVLPVLVSQETDAKIALLAEYLNSLALPEFFSNEFLDFLAITGANRTCLLKLNEEVLKNEESVERSQFRSVSIVEKYYTPSVKDYDIPEDDSGYPSHYCIEIRLTKWVEVNNHIEYEIFWCFRLIGSSGIIFKRYNDILEFHKLLCKLVAPAKLPEFPSKNYLKKLSKIDEKALNLRKANLEAYLSHIYNDIAFICTESLFFLGINESLESIWQANQVNYELRLQGPLLCSPVIDDQGHHLVYEIKLTKIQENSKKSEWTISKRYRQFDTLHNFLIKRSHSPLLLKFNEITGIKETSLPSLPGKSVAALVSAADIEARRISLEKYLEELFAVPWVLQAYVFRQFIQDPSFSEHSFKIN